MPEDHPLKRIEIRDLRQEPGARQLAESADMEPYLNSPVALMQGADPTAELETIRQLPIEKRNVWRVGRCWSGDFQILTTWAVMILLMNGATICKLLLRLMVSE